MSAFSTLPAGIRGGGVAWSNRGEGCCDTDGGCVWGMEGGCFSWAGGDVIGPPEYLRALEDDVGALWVVLFCDMSVVDIQELSALENGFGRM